MTNTDIIQKARDVLAKWRAAAKYAALHIASDAPAHPEQWGAWTEPSRKGWSPVGPLLNGPDSLALIVGTAGNPDLLDAIDGMLAAAEDDDRVWIDDRDAFAPRIAAAIIAADERMNA